jgi:hypothetical protein
MPKSRASDVPARRSTSAPGLAHICAGTCATLAAPTDQSCGAATRRLRVGRAVPRHLVGQWLCCRQHTSLRPVRCCRAADLHPSAALGVRACAGCTAATARPSPRSARTARCASHCTRRCHNVAAMRCNKRQRPISVCDVS